MISEMVSVCIFLWFAMWQYLRSAELHKVVDNSNNPWHKLVAGSEHLRGAVVLYGFLSDCWGIAGREVRYGDSAGNTVEENCSISSLIRMR